MKRRVPGLCSRTSPIESPVQGLFLVRVAQSSYRWHPQKPFFSIGFAILKPCKQSGQMISGRIYSSPKAVWKLGWFLRDFGYDLDLLGRGEVDERALLGLRGIVRIGRTSLGSRFFTNFEAFAPEGEWLEHSEVLPVNERIEEGQHDA
jgi:hypothetical protein